MHFADQCGVLALIRLLLGRGEFGHCNLLRILDIGVSLKRTLVTFVILLCWLAQGLTP